MSENPIYIINLDDKVSPAILAGILDVNVSLLYQEAQKGRLPLPLTEATYRECIQRYIQFFKKNQDLKLEKEKHEHELKLKKAESRGKNYLDEEGNPVGMHPLQAKKLEQEIRSNRVKEIQGWLAIAKERKDYISASAMYELTSPFLFLIKNILTAISLEYPETRTKIDSCFESLYSLGEKILEQVKEDESHFVEEMLNESIETDILTLGLIPETRN